MINDEDKEKVRQATDFVQLVAETVELRQRGRDFWGCCPFHGEKSPSFKVNPHTGLWHCFGCGEGGDVFSYVQKRENLEFPDAIRFLADRAGIELSEERGGRRGPKRNRLMECASEAQAFYAKMLMRGRGDGPDEARAYFSSRGFGGDVCRRWGLGYAPGRGALVRDLREAGFTTDEMVAADLAVMRSGRPSDRFYERVMFPISDEMGRVIAFGGRVIGQKKEAAKYVNTRDTAVFNKGKHLFAFDRAKETMASTGEAIVCEGYTDVIAMHENGFTNAVAALGTAFRIDHVKLMERMRARRIICMFDGDAAGQRAAERAVQYIDKTTSEFLCVVLPDNQDPMEFLSAHTAAELRSILDSAAPLMDFVFEKRLGDVDLGNTGARVAALDSMAKVLAPLKHSVVLPEYALRLAARLGLDTEEVTKAIKRAPLPDEGEGAARGSSSARRPGGAGYSGAQGYGGDDFSGPRSGPRAGSGPYRGAGRGRDGRPARSGYGSGRSSSLGNRNRLAGDGGAWGAGQGGRGGATLSASPAYDYGYADSYAAGDYGEQGAPVDDYVPAEAYEDAEPSLREGGFAAGGLSTASAPAPLTKEERDQIAYEVELLCFLAAKPAAVKPYAERISEVKWADPTHEAMAWAMLSTPAGATCAELVAAASTVEPSAPAVLSGGRLADEEGTDDRKKVEMLLDSIEVSWCRRRVASITGELAAHKGAVDERREGLFREAAQLKARIRELEGIDSPQQNP